ncbi:Outer membrane lipoprotein SlyB [Polaromonas vacuolata]|uniref:Outer membrane lipoprotein SlyB n=1 Tax=Polaromonas vacuolata TaxID=37448 RepID=A0A6H2HBX0_9BURK|nr:glycine zipper 2TM domain-containing protein [Polaromonas vacuolata]QJC56966.1 Outer membrane lipoprotein SlyB [Polaromonas vacuolata]
MDRDSDSDKSHSSSVRSRYQLLIALIVLLGVAVIVLAATLMNNRLEARTAAAGALASESTLAAAPTIAPFTSQADKSSRPDAAHQTSKPSQSIKPSSQPVPLPAVPATAACKNCGTVESVSSVQRQGQVNGVTVGDTTVGVGTIAGGILGGLLGNQIGGGRGNTAATVLGVAGGAYAGNSVEKNMKKVTVYLVRVRMDDGSIRDMEIASSVPVGAKVLVEGRNLRLANAAG